MEVEGYPVEGYTVGMELGIRGKTAVVTGASTGIGRAIAESLAAEGVRVMLSARTEATLDRAVEEIRLQGGEADGHPADVTDPDAILNLIRAARRRFGDPDILIVNAGGPPPGVPSALDEADWRRGFELTLLSAVRLAHAVLPTMRANRWGRIVNVTSLSVREPIPNLTLSNAFRAGVTGFARTLATEVAVDGVTVNNVAPGYTATARVEEVVATPEAKQKLIQDIPAKRFAEPAEIAAVATFLASQQAAYITGQTILADGGLVGSLL